MPNSVGHQDLAALIARQPAVTERWRAHVRNSTFGTIHAASLSFPRLIGATIPDPYFTQLAALDPRALEATGSVPLTVPMDPVVSAPVYDFPVVDRRLKGDRLKMKNAPSEQAEPERPAPKTPSKSKDMASRPPMSEPSPHAPASQSADETASHSALPKGDRLAPRQMQIAEPATTPIYRRAGLVPGQDTLAKRILGSSPRQPGLIAAPAEPAEDKVLRRAGIAAGQETLAKRVLGASPRQPMVIAAPAEPVEDKNVRRPGVAASHLNAIRREIARNNALAETADLESQRADLKAPLVPQARELAETADLESQRADLKASLVPQVRELEETADLESQRADLKAPLVPQVRELAETADLESQRADLYGPLTPEPAQVAALPVETEPAAPAEAAAVQPPAEAEPLSEPRDVAEVAPSADVTQPEVADVDVAEVTPETSPDTAPPAEERIASVPAQVVPPVEAKVVERFNTEVIDQLAQFAKPGAQTRVFFGTRALGLGRSSWEAWEPDETPTVLAPPHVDTEIKRVAREPEVALDPAVDQGGETIAPKGEVTGEGKRPRTPAERLNLTGATRIKHHRCLANAIYFEARGEVERGQMAVAQVVLNRVFSGYYPGNVCDVVYQNAHRRLACQFTFACDHVKDVVRDQRAWEVATRIADEALDGKFWLPEVGKATHYHATYVNPWWVRTMTKHTRLGIHIFYRPKRWGEGEDIPVWGEKLDVTGSIARDAIPAAAAGNAEKRVEAQPTPARRSIFDPVEPINLPGG